MRRCTIKTLPALYPSSGIPCPICNALPDTNTHLGLCTNLRPFINATLRSHVAKLITLLTTHTSNVGIHKLSQTVWKNSPFTSVLDDSHDIYLVYTNFMQFIPQNLADTVHAYTNNYSFTKKVIFEFMTSLQQTLYQTIWIQHNRNLHDWEKRVISLEKENDII